MLKNELKDYAMNYCNDKDVVDVAFMAVDFAVNSGQSDLIYILKTLGEIVASLGFKHNKRTDFFHREVIVCKELC